MTLEILAFGIAKEIMGGKSVPTELAEGITIRQVRQQLEDQYPQLKKLASYMIAVNDEYAEDEQILKTGDEIAIIPPVSGG
jgi:molybdopterin converting factor subunit 1